jgi:unsaturated chondroitin disaccharide hydrolase
LTADETRRRRYRDAALNILDSLCTDRYLAWDTPGWEGVLKHGVYHFHKKLGVDESVMWGEFFFLEAVAKALGIRVRTRG